MKFSVDPRDWEELRRHLHRPQRKPKPAPVPPPPPLPKASWPFRDRPLVFTAWDPGQARSGPWDVAVISVPGVAPVWLVAFGNKPLGTIAQSESPDQVVGALTALSAASGAKALVATQGGWDGVVDKYLSQGVNTCMVEAYQNEDPSHTPAQMVWQAKHDGWPYVIPVVGCYHGYPLSSYDLTPYGKNFAVWLAEEMSEDDWSTLTKLAS